jgi:hypothetical protein
LSSCDSARGWMQWRRVSKGPLKKYELLCAKTLAAKNLSRRRFQSAGVAQEAAIEQTSKWKKNEGGEEPGLAGCGWRPRPQEHRATGLGLTLPPLPCGTTPATVRTKKAIEWIKTALEATTVTPQTPEDLWEIISLAVQWRADRSRSAGRARRRLCRFSSRGPSCC